MAKPSSLISQKSSDSGLRIQLHPLVLLTISDHITRHAARSQEGPTIGALLGQQIGREITLEHVFECNLISGPQNELLLPQPWFDERLKQFKDVHKVPALDLVGWWSTAPPTGPDASHLPIHKQILQDYNESAVFLAFHPSQIESSSVSGGKLPLTVYESVYEGGDHGGDRDKAAMQLDGEEQTVSIRFRELPYTIETGEAEMISIESVARGGGNAAVSGVTSMAGAAATDAAGDAKSHAQTESTKEEKGSRAGAGVGLLTTEEEDLIASLRTRVNAIKTLESRISLIKSYVSTLSASNGKDGTQTEASDHAINNLPLSHPILRDINSLISHLALLNPSSQSDFSAETLAQTNDVLLVSLLGQLGQSVKAMRELGRKSAIVQNTKQNASARKTHPSTAAMHSRLDEEEYLAARS